MSEAELELYRTQKEQIVAIITTLSEPDPAMVDLVTSLDEMILLLEARLHEEKPANDGDKPRCAENKPSDSLGVMEDEPSFPGPNVSSSDLAKAEEDLRASLLHMQCRAPFQHFWGQKRYHNAMIHAVEERGSADDGIGEDDLHVRVLFLQPTHRRMAPCKFYLDGKCRFDEKQCHFSHGEVFRLDELEPYVPPDFAALKVGSACLCMLEVEEGLWEHGTIADITPTTETEEGEITVRIDGRKNIRIVSIAQLVPDPPPDKPEEDEEADGADETIDIEGLEGADAGEEEEQEAEMTFVPHSAWSQSSHVAQVDNSFAGWEAHTKGVGSKLMSQMGFVVGQGLGRNSGGRTEPVEAQVLPKGRSLDYCMALREQKDFPKVAKPKKKPKLLKGLEANALKRKQKKNVFDVLNSHLGGKRPVKAPTEKNVLNFNPELELRKNKVSKGSSGSQAKNLNVEVLKVHDKMKSLERELIGLRSSHERSLTSDKRAAASLASKIKAKETELSALQKTDTTLSQMKAREKVMKDTVVF
ncbi:hypothetical protein RvY_08494 [Ramazzottius varieornatus]|uniref:Zinc finger CCCH-type with G patch domain-containing protein n=1 Tax=Ramazzottius varieornatus TaxID=947166 RepID=A0A1D1VAM4_RAMVA|nr:hypothetical protein RvY_08494 [Ramazzottius varieornatus]